MAKRGVLERYQTSQQQQMQCIVDIALSHPEAQQQPL